MTPNNQSHASITPSWLVEKASSCMKAGNVFASKSWLLTAKSLFPDSFAVQYEELQMERKTGKVARYGKLFYDMMCFFTKEQVLWDELSKVFFAQNLNSSQTKESTFLKEMFESLSETHQRELLLMYANHQSVLTEKCTISLMVLGRFKGAVKDHGLRLINILREAEEKECATHPVNIYRKMLVCDVLPLVLRSADTYVSDNPKKSKAKSSLLITEEDMLSYMNFTIQFFVCYAINKSSLEKGENDKPWSLKLSDLDDNISPWHLLHENMILFAEKLSWKNVIKIKDKMDPSKSRTFRNRWKTILNSKESKPAIGIFYSALQLFLYTVIEYCSFTIGSNRGVEGDKREYLLLENIEQLAQKDTFFQNNSRTQKKRKRDDAETTPSDYQSATEEVTVIHNPGFIRHVSDAIGDSLQVAMDCRNFLRLHFSSEFTYLMKRLKTNSWAWMGLFDIDASIFQGKYKDVIESIGSVEACKSSSTEIFSLQLASSLFCIKEHKAACTRALQSISKINTANFVLQDVGKPKTPNYSKLEGRSVLILPNMESEILNYCCQIIIESLKMRLQDTSGDCQDKLLGQLIVISQLNYSKQEDMLNTVFMIIKANNRFIFPTFFDYVTNIHILEEIAHLYSIDSIKMELYIQDRSNTKKTITRGVNKNTQNGFRSYLRRQVQCCGQPIEPIVYDFLCKGADELIDVL